MHLGKERIKREQRARKERVKRGQRACCVCLKAGISIDFSEMAVDQIETRQLHLRK